MLSAQIRNCSASCSLLENGSDLAVAESGLPHAELPQVLWEKILLLATVVSEGTTLI